jgi:hypothetical protein
MTSEEIKYILQSIFQINSYITTDDKIIINYTTDNPELFKYIINLTYNNNIHYTYNEDKKQIIIINDKHSKHL